MDNNGVANLLKKILGQNAFENSMKVSPEVEVLCIAVRYLTTQLQITERWCDEDGKEHIQSVIKSTEEILNKPLLTNK